MESKQHINRRWFGVLTNDNIEGVVEVVRDMLKGRFAIAEALNCDSDYTQLRFISADCSVDSRWTSAPEDEAVRLFTDDDGRRWFGFSAGGYLWTFSAQPDPSKEHEDYLYPYFSFEHDKFTVTQRAPAGKGYLHKRIFGAHRRDDEIAELKDIVAIAVTLHHAGCHEDTSHAAPYETCTQSICVRTRAALAQKEH